MIFLPEVLCRALKVTQRMHFISKYENICELIQGYFCPIFSFTQHHALAGGKVSFTKLNNVFILYS